MVISFGGVSETDAAKAVVRRLYIAHGYRNRAISSYIHTLLANVHSALTDIIWVS